METSSPHRPIRTALVSGLTLVALLATQPGCNMVAGGQNAQGARYFETGQYNAAMVEFQKAIASDPTSADGYYNLARVTHQMGVQRNDAALTEQAEALYNQCLDHDPNHVDCYRSLAVLLTETGRSDKSFTLLKNWAANNPNLADARIELARLYEEFGEPQTAKKYLEDAVQQDPNNSRAWLALAKMREGAGDLTQALANYQRSYSLNSMQPMVQERIAALSQRLSNAYDAGVSAGGTMLAQPPSTSSASGGRY
jgi:tetratricopeptide (TPR) repeat protein